MEEMRMPNYIYSRKSTTRSSCCNRCRCSTQRYCREETPGGNWVWIVRYVHGDYGKALYNAGSVNSCGVNVHLLDEISDCAPRTYFPRPQHEPYVQTLERLAKKRQSAARVQQSQRSPTAVLYIHTCTVDYLLPALNPLFAGLSMLNHQFQYFTSRTKFCSQRRGFEPLVTCAMR